MTITFGALKFDWKQQTVNATSVPSIQENGGDTSLNVAESPQEAAVGSSAKTSGNSVGKNGVHKETSLMVDAKESEMVSSQRKYCRVLFDEIFADMSELIRKWTYTPKVEHALYRAYYNVCGAIVNAGRNTSPESPMMIRCRLPYIVMKPCILPPIDWSPFLSVSALALIHLIKPCLTTSNPL